MIQSAVENCRELGLGLRPALLLFITELKILNHTNVSILTHIECQAILNGSITPLSPLAPVKVGSASFYLYLLIYWVFSVSI